MQYVDHDDFAAGPAVIDGRELFALPRACALSRVSVLQ
jgi:hypothetical protein